MNAKSTARTPPDELVIKIARELYDRFVMGGWGPQDAYPQIREWLTQWQAGREGLLEALRLADELVRTDGHTLTPPCKFGGCTCGGIEAYKVARSNYVRARREALLGTEKERKS